MDVRHYVFGLQMPGRVWRGDSETREGYTGHELDPETGQLYMGARYYDPGTGRFLVIDPLWASPTQIDKSPYAYAWNDPVNLYDPDGRHPVLWLARAAPLINQGLRALGGALLGTAGVMTGMEAAQQIDLREEFSASSLEPGAPPFGASEMEAPATTVFPDTPPTAMPGPEGITPMDPSILGGAIITAGALPDVRKAVNSNMPHAVGRGVERGVFESGGAAAAALKELTKGISQNGLPEGTIPDTARDDRVLVPVGNAGYAVYQVAKNGTAKLKTVLNQRPPEENDNP